MFCGLEQLLDPKLAPRKATEEKTETTKEEMEPSNTSEGAELLPQETARATEATKRTKDTEPGIRPDKPFCREMVSVGGIILLVLVVVGHIYT